jgi:hypothetical protein
MMQKLYRDCGNRKSSRIKSDAGACVLPVNVKMDKLDVFATKRIAIVGSEVISSSRAVSM